MNHEAKKILLQKLLHEVLAETIKLNASASVKSTSNKHAEILAKADRWQQQCDRMLSGLKSQEGFLKVRYGNEAKLSYPGRQSLRSHRGNIAELRGLAKELNIAIGELIKALTGPDLAIETLIKSLEKILEAGDDLSLTAQEQQQLTTAVQQLDPGGAGGGGSMAPLAPNLLTFAIALFVILKRTLGKKT